MMLNTWQFTKGYVRIQVTGFGLERFLNMVAFRGIYMWDVTRTAQGAELNVSIKGFRMLRGCARKTKCRTKILQKSGVPFILHRYRKRKLLMGGLAFFIAGLFTLSSFIWHIELVGNQSIAHETLLVFFTVESQSQQIKI